MTATNSPFSFPDARSKDQRRVNNRMPMGSWHGLVFLIVATFVATPAPLVLADETEILVGHSAAGQLKVDPGFTQPLELEVSIFPGISGYATGLLGMHSSDLDEPGNDFFKLSTAANLRFILLAKDPGMEVWNETGSGYMGIGETFLVGQPPFDTHPIWNLVAGPPGTAYSLTLKLRDLNGVYQESAPFLLSFTPVQIRHQINIRQEGPLLATLTWTTNAPGWTLESATSVAAVNWDGVTNVPGIVGTNFSLSISNVSTQKFFRLHKP